MSEDAQDYVRELFALQRRVEAKESAVRTLLNIPEPEPNEGDETSFDGGARETPEISVDSVAEHNDEIVAFVQAIKGDRFG